MNALGTNHMVRDSQNTFNMLLERYHLCNASAVYGSYCPEQKYWRKR